MRRINPFVVSLAALVCGLIAVALGVVIVVRNRDEPSTSAPTEQPSATLPADTPTPTEAARYPAVRVVGDLPIPPDLIMLTTTGGYGHGTGTPWRTRLIVGAAEGPQVVELSHPGAPAGELMGILADRGRGPIYATVCGGEQCLYEGGVTAATSTFYRSKDGGFRWTEVNTRDGRWWPRLAVAGDFVIVNFDGAAAAAVYAISNKPLTRQEPWAGLVRYHGEPAWISRQFPMLENADGSSLLKFDFLPIDAKVTDYAQASDESSSLITWVVQTPNPNSHGFDERFFVTAVVGNDVRTFESRLPIGALVSPWRDGKWLVDAEVAMRPNTCGRDYAKDGDHGLSPALFDPATGDLAFFGAPYFPDGCAEGAETVVQFWSGTAATIVTPGDCLNLRTSPRAAAKVGDCLPDGVVVLKNGPITESDGIRWVSITTLGAERGWVAEPFLRSP